jgi:hypothetical protein
MGERQMFPKYVKVIHEYLSPLLPMYFLTQTDKKDTDLGIGIRHDWR